MTATAPPTEALATASTAIVISQFDVLLGDIAEANAKAADVTIDALVAGTLHPAVKIDWSLV